MLDQVYSIVQETGIFLNFPSRSDIPFRVSIGTRTGAIIGTVLV